VHLTTKKSGADETTKKPRKAKPKAGVAIKGAAKTRPKLRASHTAPAEPLQRKPRAPRKRAASAAGGVVGRAGQRAPLRKAPLIAPKRASKRPVAPLATPEPSAAAKELAVALATEGIEKKALGIEILDVTGKVDYTDFLVVMTGRSDRHVHSIATGIEEAMRRRKVAALSMEGLSSATWVLIDFGDVVVHVFQEEARLLYDIEGLWIDAGRVPVPREPGAPLPGAR
jgi:ribosome-associated protein